MSPKGYLLPVAAVCVQLLTPAAAFDSSTVEQPTEFGDIWRAALKVITREGADRPVLLVDETVGTCDPAPRHPCFSRVRWQYVQSDKRVTTELQNRLESALREPPLKIPSLMPGAQAISRADLERRSHASRDPHDFWTRWYEEFPRSRGYVLLSTPAVSAEKNSALLMLTHAYGSLGAEGLLLLLDRGDSEWRVRRKWTLWMS